MGSARTEILEVLLQRGDATTPEFKGALTRLSADLRERLARGTSTSADVFAGALEALAKIKGGRHADVRMSCLFDCVHFFYITGYASLALQAAGQLRSLARLTGNKKWIRKAHNMAGIVNADCGNVAEAIYEHSCALAIANGIGDSEGELLGFINLGVALNYAGLYREALPCLQRAVLLSESDSQLEKHNAAALANCAQSYWYLDEPHKGFEAISLSLSRSQEPTDSASALSMTVREFTYVLLALGLGKIALAREHSEACSRLSKRSGTLRTQYMAAIAASLCEIHGGNVDMGLAQLESILSVSDVIGSARTEALVALVRAYDEAGQPERALIHMKSLLQQIRGMREQGILALGDAPRHLNRAQQPIESAHDLRALEFLEAKLRAQVSERELVNSRIEMLERLAVTADLREEASGEHGYRVGRLSALTCALIGFTEEQCTAIDAAARLHDLGKISVPDRILLNSRELKDAERHFVSMHAMIGAELLAKSNIPQLRIAEEIARHHHEWWDGTGYPSKLSGKRIPLHARIVALADVFDALTHGHSDLDAYLGQASKNSPFLQARHKIRLMLTEERENERRATVVGNETRH